MTHLRMLIIISSTTLVACAPGLSSNGNTPGSREGPLTEVHQHQAEQSQLNRTIQFWLHQHDSTKHMADKPDGQNANQRVNQPPDRETNQQILHPAKQQAARSLARPIKRGIQRQLDRRN